MLPTRISAYGLARVCLTADLTEDGVGIEGVETLGEDDENNEYNQTASKKRPKRMIPTIANMTALPNIAKKMLRASSLARTRISRRMAITTRMKIMALCPLSEG
jgi:hypothetical protein